MKLIPARTAALVVAFGSLVGGAEQDPTAAFLKSYYAVYNAAGAGQLSAFYASDATFSDPSFGFELKGRQQIHDLLTKALAKYTRLDHEVLHTVRSGNELVVEGLMVAQLQGKPIRVRYVSVFTFNDRGQIVMQRDLYDLLHYFEQLGVVPPQFRAKSPR